jgi:iron complex transport system substrate-binding protein
VLFACGEERATGAGAGGSEALVPAGALPRVVSLNPSITNILVALGATDALVGVDDWSARVQPAASALPRVGGLFNPSLEAILALEPDIVALVPSAQQRDLRDRLVAVDVEVLALANLTLAEVLESIHTLGAHVDREAAATARIEAIRDALRATAQLNAGRPRPRTVLVLQRDPLYVVGRGSFLDEMLAAAGAENLGAAFDEEYPRAGTEWLIATAPELVLDAAGDAASAQAHWAQWPSLPAVAADQIVSVPAEDLTMPGPDLDRSLALLADWVDWARPTAAARVEPAP